MQVSSEIIGVIAEQLQSKFGFSTQTELDKAIADVLKKTHERGTHGNQISLSRLIRGMRAEAHMPIDRSTAEADVQYARAMTTGTTPGSYLIPTIQASEIIGALTLGGVARSAGVRIWDLAGIQKMNVPTALSSPVWVWMAQNSIQTSTDPGLGQMAFDLKERRCLVAIPNQLLSSSVPAFDTMLATLIGFGAAEHEDTAFFATSTVSNGPTALMSAANITTINAANNNANGGNLVYADILAVLKSASAAKAKGPFVWFSSPRTLYTRIMGLLDLQSRPLYLPTLSQGLQTTNVSIGGVQPVGNLMGYPLYVTPSILENEAIGSGSNQSHLIFTNPSYLHIAQDGNIEMQISTERFFDANQTAIRATGHADFGFAPAAGVVCLLGIN